MVYATLNLAYSKEHVFFFFFLFQQFIKWPTAADRGSYLRNYVQKKHTNMRNEES